MVISILFVCWQLDFLRWEAARPVKKLLSPAKQLLDSAEDGYHRLTLPAGASTPLSAAVVNKVLKGKLTDEMELIVAAKEGVLSSGYRVRSGSWFCLEIVSGQWSAGKDKGTHILKQKTADCLLASLYLDNWFVVKSQPSWREAAIDGEVKLTINEDTESLSDNSGELRVRLIVFQKASP